MTPHSIATRAVWAGERPSLAQGATQTPIVYSAAFGYPDADVWLDVAQGRATGHIYSRNSNPTVGVFEEKVRILEGAQAATSFSSGMAAISNTLFALLAPGDRIVYVNDVYGGTSILFQEILPRFGIGVTQCATDAADGIEEALGAGCTLLYLETPTNPALKIVDIARLAAAGRRAGATVVVDNTFATPVNQSPLALGADLVVHSATKFLGGHGDALGGAVCGDFTRVRRIDHFRQITGAAMDPMAAFLLIRGLKTLPLRVAQQNENAMRIAEWLTQQPAIERVFYPGLPAHPGHDIACRQMRGFGSVLAFQLRDGFDGVRRVLPRLELAHRAANLGAVETIAGPPATTSHVECTAEQRSALGIPEGLIRYSVGIEDADDLIADLSRALDGR